MIRTVIEVEGKDSWDYEQQLKSALDKLGYEPKPSEDALRWKQDVWSALQEAGVDVTAITEQYRSKRNKITQ
ncbi:MAG: hypothetical protein G4V63_14745 [Candidatus Afipia apatlaquensis]|uniref:Uncharacterized protein n=1 Tax=Candidatus Afipia apatlaquensis TaxID=2712852 RepID=A0A7C9RFU7_9BRAD|nr:hypothetical protein [Candidatus Afipia apatlaquensis]